MKIHLLFLMVILLFRFTMPELKAQNLIIQQNNGSVNYETLSSVQKLSFLDGNLVVAFKSGSNDSYGLSTITKLYFDVHTSVSESTSQQSTQLTVFPNPVNNELSVQNMPEGATLVYIYRIDGELVFRTQVSSGNETIDVSNLQSGLYILIAKGCTAKFIKL